MAEKKGVIHRPADQIRPHIARMIKDDDVGMIQRVNSKHVVKEGVKMWD